MKRSIYTLFAGILLIGTSMTALAQGAGPQNGGTPPPNEGKAQKGKQGKADPFLLLKRDQEVLSKLNLTSEQETSVKKLKSETEAKLKEVMKGKAKKEERAQLREKVKEVVEGYKKGLEGILTPVQYADYEKGMKALAKKTKDKKDGGN